MWNPHVILSSPLMNSTMSTRRSRAVLGASLEASRVVGGAREDAAPQPVWRRRPHWSRTVGGGTGGGSLVGPSRGTSEEEAHSHVGRRRTSAGDDEEEQLRTRGDLRRRRAASGGGPLDPVVEGDDRGEEGQCRVPGKTENVGGEKNIWVVTCWPNKNGWWERGFGGLTNLVGLVGSLLV